MKTSQNDNKGLIPLVEQLMRGLKYWLDKEGYYFSKNKRNALADIIFNTLDDEVEPFFNYEDLEDGDINNQEDRNNDFVDWHNKRTLNKISMPNECHCNLRDEWLDK